MCVVFQSFWHQKICVILPAAAGRKSPSAASNALRHDWSQASPVDNNHWLYRNIIMDINDYPLSINDVIIV